VWEDAWNPSTKSDMGAGSVTQTVVFMQLKRHVLAMTVDKTGCYSYSVSGLLECMHFPVPFHFAIDSS
jgi:hypothetical protein